MGIDIIGPTNNKSKSENVTIFRRNKYDILANWKKSSIRNEWLQKGRKFPELDFEVQKLTGLEFWFTPYLREPPLGIQLKAPPWYKMARATISVISILL
jgi:uncharacterized protein